MRKAYAATAVLLALSGCHATGMAPGEATGLTERDLLNAPVPSLCEHDPGTLVDGTLPDDGHPGEVHIATYMKGDEAGKSMMAFGDLTGDGVDDGAFVTNCGAGGVGWPATVQAYTAGPTHLGGIDLGSVTQGRELVESVGITEGTVRIIWLTNGPDDPACCPTIEMQGVFRPDNGTLKSESVTKVSG